MRVALVMGLVAVAATGCTSPEIADCERRVQDSLSSPATYKRASASSIRDTSQKPAMQLVSIEYDAQNGYGALTRDKAVCEYFVKDGKPQLEGMLAMHNGPR